MKHIQEGKSKKDKEFLGSKSFKSKDLFKYVNSLPDLLQILPFYFVFMTTWNFLEQFFSLWLFPFLLIFVSLIHTHTLTHTPMHTHSRSHSRTSSFSALFFNLVILGSWVERTLVILTANFLLWSLTTQKLKCVYVSVHVCARARMQ